MTEAYDEEILKLEAKIEGYDTLESILGSKMQDINIAGQPFQPTHATLVVHMLRESHACVPALF